ncbi:hypothetical protein SALBM135S_06088 [Streptomyces alboniger]
MAAAENDDGPHDEIFPRVAAPADGSPWRAPADLEQHLYELREADDPYAYLRAVAVEGLYRPVASHEEDAGRLLTVDLPDGRRRGCTRRGCFRRIPPSSTSP